MLNCRPIKSKQKGCQSSFTARQWQPLAPKPQLTNRKISLRLFVFRKADNQITTVPLDKTIPCCLLCILLCSYLPSFASPRRNKIEHFHKVFDFVFLLLLFGCEKPCGSYEASCCRRSTEWTPLGVSVDSRTGHTSTAARLSLASSRLNAKSDF